MKLTTVGIVSLTRDIFGILEAVGVSDPVAQRFVLVAIVQTVEQLLASDDGNLEEEPS